MPQVVDIPEMGAAEFPDGMSPEQIAAVVRSELRAFRAQRLARMPSMQAVTDVSELGPVTPAVPELGQVLTAPPEAKPFAPGLGPLPGVQERDEAGRTQFEQQKRELDALDAWRTRSLSGIPTEDPDAETKRADVEATYKRER